MKTYNVEILIAIPIVLVVLVGPALLLIGCFGSKNSQRKRQKFRDPAESSGTILRIWKTTDYQPEGPYYEPWVVKYSYYAGGILYKKNFQTNNRKVAHSLQANDKITVYYDRQNPDNAVTSVQMEQEKSVWKNMLIGFLIFTLIVAACSIFFV